MKKFWRFLLIIAVMVLLAVPVPTLAAGTVTTSYEQVSDTVWTLTYTCTADSGDASFPATASPYVYGYVIRVVTNPGTPAPTDNYDITLTDANGCDVMGGSLADRDEATTEHAVPRIGNVYGGVYVAGPLTFTLTNNDVNSAVVVVVVYIELPRY